MSVAESRSLTLKSRLAKFALMVILDDSPFWLNPPIETESETGISEPPSVIVPPAIDDENFTLSVPGVALASCTASRSEKSPAAKLPSLSSMVVSTQYVARSWRGSRASKSWESVARFLEC